LIARAHAPDIPDDRWFAMTRLDENRAKTQLARKAGVPVAEVTNMAIWGNHSVTQYPDAAHARIGSRPVPEVIADEGWLRGEFISTVQKRGAAIISARGASSAASAANAAIDSVRSIHAGTAPGDWTSLAVVSHGEYGIPEGLLFSYPVAVQKGSWSVVEGIEQDDFAQEKIRATTDELLQERDLVKDLVKR
jgi:malate dehydrogenase